MTEEEVVDEQEIESGPIPIQKLEVGDAFSLSLCCPVWSRPWRHVPVCCCLSASRCITRWCHVISSHASRNMASLS